MDTKKIGKFLRTLRQEQNLTQEELGEKLGATNKTISRWETGTYMPPVDILLAMSKLYGVSVNEILSGERLATADYHNKAEENIVTTINDNSVVAKRSKKILIICLAVILVLAIACATIIICFTADTNIHYYVTYDSNGGSNVPKEDISIKPEHVEYSHHAHEPDVPQKKGYSFVGWFTGNDDQAERWDFYKMNVTSDITLYAKWEVATEGIKYEEYQISEFGNVVRVYAVESNGAGSNKIKDKHIVIPSYYNGSPVLKISEYAFANLDIQSVVIPDTVIEIEKGAFTSCPRLTEVKFGKGVKTIGPNAFYSCTKLKNVDLPANLKRIEEWAFRACENLQKVTIPDQVEYIGADAFRQCHRLYSVTLGASLMQISQTAFEECDRLVEVHDMCKYINAVDNANWFPYALDVYKNDAISTKIYETDEGFVFYDVDNETQLIAYIGDEQTITLPSDYNGKSYTLRDEAFAWSYDLIDVTIGGNIDIISRDAFMYCNQLSKVTLLDGVTKICVGAFQGCFVLEQIDIPNSVTQIDGFAFALCKRLSSITIPDSITTINGYTFDGCESLKKVELPSNLTTIAAAAFRDCKALEELSIPSSVEMLDYAFSKCFGLKKIEVEEGNANYHSDGNCLIHTASKTLLLATSDCVIPTDGSVTRIPSKVFQGNRNILSIHIPASITEIGEGAFGNCYMLREIIVDENNACYKMSNDCLISIADRKVIALIRNGEIPDDGTVTSIGSLAVANALTFAIEIPKSVIQIAKDTFANYSGVFYLKYDGTMKECAENTEYGKDVTQLKNVECIQCTDGELYRKWVEDYAPDETAMPD